MYYLPQAEGMLLHTFNNRSRVCGYRCVARLKVPCAPK